MLIPLGGGGLVAGAATAIKGAADPDVRVIGVQAEGAAAYPTSLATGHPVTLTSMKHDGRRDRGRRPGEVPFAAIVDYVDEVITVSEESLSSAMVMLLERAKMVVEPAGAAAVAAVLDRPQEFGTPIVAVLSGGNIDPLLMGKLIRHGMAAAGRYLQLRVRVPDVPGGLAKLLGELASLGANVLEVSHERPLRRPPRRRGRRPPPAGDPRPLPRRRTSSPASASAATRVVD